MKKRVWFPLWLFHRKNISIANTLRQEERLFIRKTKLITFEQRAVLFLIGVSNDNEWNLIEYSLNKMLYCLSF